MAKKAYIGVNGVARNVKKMYVGVEGYKQVDGVLSPWTEYGLSSTQTVYTIIRPTHSVDSPYYNFGASTVTYTLQSLNDYAIDEGASQYFVTSPPSDGNIAEYYYLPGTSLKQVVKYSLVSTLLARRIKKAYIGVGGVARPCFGHDPIEYYGTVTPLSDARQSLMGGSVGNYAVFAGGQKNYTDQTTVYAYDASLTLTTPTALSAVSNGSANSPSVGDYVLFGPLGETGSGNNPSIMNAYNASLTRSTPTSLTQGRTHPGQAHLGTAYALVAGGSYGNGGSTSSTRVDAYNTSLTRTTVTALSVGRERACGVSGDNYVLMAGGDAIVSNQIVFYSTVDAYNNTLVRSIPTTLSVPRQNACGVSVGGYMLVIGGSRSNTTSNTTYSTIDAYNNSLTRSTPISLSVARDAILGTNLGRYAILLGGRGGSSFTWQKIAEMYTTNLVRKTLPSMSIARALGAIANAGNYTLVAGNSSGTKVVEAYAYYPDA